MNGATCLPLTKIQDPPVWGKSLLLFLKQLQRVSFGNCYRRSGVGALYNNVPCRVGKPSFDNNTFCAYAIS